MDGSGTTLGLIGVVCALFLAHGYYSPKVEEARTKATQLERRVEFLTREKELTEAQLKGALMAN